LGEKDLAKSGWLGKYFLKLFHLKLNHPDHSLRRIAIP